MDAPANAMYRCPHTCCVWPPCTSCSLVFACCMFRRNTPNGDHFQVEIPQFPECSSFLNSLHDCLWQQAGNPNGFPWWDAADAAQCTVHLTHTMRLDFTKDKDDMRITEYEMCRPICKYIDGENVHCTHPRQDMCVASFIANVSRQDGQEG
mmetsp:Transcript_62127/g.102563  ORF Transcript_62127/g.102563 Transcript_62127/m.102563 type:complete len:151 (+) Transcript_62127:215-667(+)